MYSRTIELTGLGLVAWGVASLLGVGAGLIVGGFSLLLVGGTTDDGEVRRTLRRGVAWLRFLYHRQVLRESLGERGTQQPRSPHPPIEIDPETEAMAERLAEERGRRGNGRTRQGVP